MKYQTHCKYGHPFDDANTHLSKGGHRSCRICGARRKREQVERANQASGRVRKPKVAIASSVLWQRLVDGPDTAYRTAMLEARVAYDAAMAETKAKRVYTRCGKEAP